MVLGLDHVGIHVADIERSIAFYQAVFGLKVAARLSLGEERIAFLATGTGRLELIQDDRPGRSTGVVDHLALRVHSVAATLETLRSHGVELLDDAPIEVPSLDARILFCLGPDGERIELYETG